MSPVDAAIVRRKLGRIVASLGMLESMAGMGLDEYRGDVWRRKGAERVVQEAIEAALDINAHLLAELGAEVPDDYFGGFLKIADLDVLPMELARDLAPSSGVRNRLVHEYDTIDDAKVLAAIRAMLALYPRYVGAIEAHLTKAGL